MPLSTPSNQDENNKSALLGVLFFVAAIVILLLAAEITDEIFWAIHPGQPHMDVDIYTPIFIWGPVSLIYFLAIGLVGASVDPAITVTIIMVAMMIFGAIRTCHWYRLIWPNDQGQRCRSRMLHSVGNRLADWRESDFYLKLGATGIQFGNTFDAHAANTPWRPELEDRSGARINPGGSEIFALAVADFLAPNQLLEHLAFVPWLSQRPWQSGQLEDARGEFLEIYFMESANA